MLTYTGTAEEQWVQMGLDVAMGLVSAQEVYDFANELKNIDGVINHLRDELSRSEAEVEELRGYEDEASELRDEVDDLKREIISLKSNRG